MRGNNLLMSLLANSSANPRSNSMMHKESYTNPYSAIARSTSLSSVQCQRKQTKEAGAQRNIRLVRLVHFLNLKVKNQYYFFFCKLEHVLKNRKKIENQQLQKVQNSNQKAKSQDRKQLVSKIIDKNEQKEKNMKNGIAILCDSFSTFNSKRESLQQKQSMHHGFLNILIFSNKKRGGALLKTFFSKQEYQKYRSVFDIFAKIEKDRIRNQIFFINLTQIIAKHQAQSFKNIKLFAKSIQEQKLKNQKVDELNLFQNCSNQLIGEEQISSKYQFSQRANRTKKIILRQRKMLISEPISLPANKKQVIISQDEPLQSILSEGKEQKMTRCPNKKTDTIVSCLPDLNDNCNLFRQSEIFTPSSKMYTVQSYLTEFKQSEFQCLTDRSMKNTQSELSKSMKNTPKYKKDKSSINLTIKKQVNLANPDQSPLIKIDEILNRIQQMKSFRSTEKSSEKKTVNVNIEKRSQVDQLNINKYRMKTPNRKYEESQKENIRQRLITERQKPTKKVRGLESGLKYRSTVLTKSRDQKGEFTAKKMKMQIQNIINRRNKQLYYRVESTQLN